MKLLYTVRGVSELLELDEAGVLERHGVSASRYAEFAMLRGDPSDGLPGVHGIGEKTARALEVYPFIEAMLEDAEAGSPRPGPLKGKPTLRASLREATGYLNAMRRVVPVNARAPIQVWGGTRDDQALLELAEHFGLRGPVRRVLAALDSVTE